MNTKKIIYWSIALVVVAFTVWVTFVAIEFKKEITTNNSKADSLQVVIDDLQGSAADINTANATITSLKQDTAKLNDAISGRNENIDSLKADTARLHKSVRDLTKRLDICSGKTKAKSVASTAKSVRRKTTRSHTTATSFYGGGSDVTETRVVRSVGSSGSGSGTSSLSNLRDENGEIIFCCPANGRVKDLNFPHLAMQNGITFSGFKGNGDKGYNWKVEPTNGYVGDYGVTTQGVFYVSDALTRQTLSKVGIQLEYLAIKGPFTNWNPKTMTKSGNYWIYKTQS